MKYILTILISLTTIHTQSQPCNCSSALSYTIQKVETNYSGLKDKVRDDNRAAYTAFKTDLTEKAALPENQQKQPCGTIINAYLKFFKDGHLNLNINSAPPTNNPDSIRAFFANTPKVDYTKEAFQTYLKTNAKNLKPLEGIWQNEAGNYTVGIKYQNDKYIGFILKADSIYWMPGQVKMEIIPSKDSVISNFYMRDHSLQKYIVNIDDVRNGYFDMQNIGKWLKLDDKGKIVYKDFYPNSGVVSFRKLSDKTNLITIKSFSENFRKLIDSVVSANDKTIRAADNLIVDVRGNGGGSDISYASLEKYLFTHVYTTIGAEVYCTNDNIEKFRQLATNPIFTSQEQENFKKRVKGMEEHLNQYWSQYPVYNYSDSFPVLDRPKRIAVIIDSFCASTTEQFLLDPVLNSKKATILGTHSAGVLDYANITFFRVPGTDFTVNYPTSRSNRIELGKGIDNKGIQPNIQLDNTTKDWVKYAQNYLEGKR